MLYTHHLPFATGSLICRSSLGGMFPYQSQVCVPLPTSHPPPAHRALATVTAELGAPRPSRPNEGSLQVAVDVTPTAAAGAERSNELSVGLERLLERSLRESRCVDLESLCVVADEKVGMTG